MLKITKTRNKLASNVDIMLEILNSHRQRKKINSDDLFGESSTTSKISWKDETATISDLEVLALEKESLGVYVSGNPLAEYQKIQDWIRETTFADDIHIVIVEKIKKIFTKANTMMFALSLSTLSGSVEGIIFPKIAPHYSPMLEEKKLYWIKGRISQKKKKKKDEEEVAVDTETEMEHKDVQEVKEYDELPKLIIDSLARIEESPTKLFDESNQLAVSRISLINGINWQAIKDNPLEFDTDLQSKKTTPNKSKPASEIKTIKITKNYGSDILQTVHQSISREEKPDTVQIELYIETNNELKKVKGPLWIPKAILTSFKDKN